MKYSKGQSEVISTVLMILLVIVAITIVMGFVVPFVKEKLTGGDCLNVVGKMEITNNLRYTCYNVTSKTMRVQVYYGDIENLTKGFRVAISSAGESKSFEVTAGTSDANIKMLNASATVAIPIKNQEKTYVLAGINSIPESVGIYPILTNGKTCEASDTLTTISVCSSL